MFFIPGLNVKTVKIYKKMKGDYQTLIINAGSFGISLTNIDIALKIILVSVTIGYTIQKWLMLNKNKKK